MRQQDPDSFWYAVNSTEILRLPDRHLETFGTTVFNYYMVSELMDTVNRVRVREGRIKAERPQIIAPAAYAKLLLEGFGEEAGRFLEWMREHRKDLRPLQYGFTIHKQEITEQVYSDPLEDVVDRVKRHVEGRNDPLSALIIGIDDPWEVCLLKLLVEIIGQSHSGNVEDLERRGLFADAGGLPQAVRARIETLFREAVCDASQIQRLGRLLQEHKVFEEYEDRFFALVRAARGTRG